LKRKKEPAPKKFNREEGEIAGRITYLERPLSQRCCKKKDLQRDASPGSCQREKTTANEGSNPGGTSFGKEKKKVGPAFEKAKSGRTLHLKNQKCSGAPARKSTDWVSGEKKGIEIGECNFCENPRRKRNQRTAPRKGERTGGIPART